ncbi:hypothetical protein RD792_012961 [Penstemon davidsonii]|uniref:Cytochrome c-type biogenesis protein n=1 Tax=Penstemon davidsonii TaxID=160366 RepID=A0ABR0CZ40_9LAMI|nr:hypothetical protein RD792_012961 [Penstemon davidsonii]
MEGKEDEVTKQRVVEARARNISHNVRCTECGSQSIEDSQADVAILLRKVHPVCFFRAYRPAFRKLVYTRVEFLVIIAYWYEFVSKLYVLIVYYTESTLISIAFIFKIIRDEIRDGKSDKEIYKKLEDDFGETVLYAPKFDMQTAALWLSPLLVAGGAGGLWAYKKYKQKTNVHIMALNLIRGVPLTPKEREVMLEVLTPPPPPGGTSSWWRRWLPQ